jgi:hypothetical protein
MKISALDLILASAAIVTCLLCILFLWIISNV